MSILSGTYEWDTDVLTSPLPIVHSRPAGTVRLIGAGVLLGEITWQALADIAETTSPTGAAKRLNGPAVFACVKDRTLFIARDQMGQKSIFVKKLENSFQFSESLPALATPGCTEDSTAIADYLCLGYIPAPKTRYREIQKLPAAHLLEANSMNLAFSPYWKPAFSHQKLSFEEALEETERLIRLSVQKCLAKGAHPVSLLSGGIDSSLITAIAKPQNACTIYFEEPQYNEQPLAKLTADSLGIPHHAKCLVPEDACILPELAANSGEPFADSSLLPTTYAMRMAAAMGDLILSGDGGDELFGGYRRYQLITMRQKLGEPLARTGGYLLRALLSPFPAAKDNRTRLADFHRTATAMSAPFLPAYSSFQQIFSIEELHALCPELCPEYLAEWQERSREIRNLPEKANYLDLTGYLPDDGCRKTAIAADGLQTIALAPLLEMDVANFALSLPFAFRFHPRKTKLILRALGKKSLPETILVQPKRGFGVPVAQWFRQGALRTQLELAPCPAIFQQKEFVRLLHEHFSGRNNHAPKLWAILQLILQKQ